MRTDAAPLGWGWTIRFVIGLIGLALAMSSAAPRLRAQAQTLGEWKTLASIMPINPVHAALMNNGKVLIVSGSGNVATETNFQSAVLDLVTETITMFRGQSWDMFCNGMVVLSDGRVFINGGNLKYDPFWGEPRNAVFDPATGAFSDVQNMAHGRWYPTVTSLGDGRVMTFSGLLETGGTNTSVEFYTPGTGWSQEYPAGWTPPLYPRMHLVPDGRVIYTGSGPGTRFFNPTTRTWTGVVATTKFGNTRNYGTSVLLPLKASEGHKGRVMIFGGASPATATTEIMDTSAPTPQWNFGPNMSQPRIELNATLLPNGTVLVTGGSGEDEKATTASYNADLYDPVTNTFSSAGVNAYPRLYHSNALLLPDATVLLLGGNPTRGSYESRMEIYSPAYLFKVDADGHPIPRPTISSNPGAISYGASFEIPTADPTNISSVVLVRPGTPTHAFDMDQRLVELSFNSAGGVLTATAPPNGNVAPPGYYMLFILNSAGVPSVASFVRLTTAANQAPTATIVNPATNLTVNPGGAVSFSGTGSDPDGTISTYAWTFPGGSPASSTLPGPVNVTYSAPGTYQASLSVTDNGGLASAAVTRSITVSDFSLSATPPSNSAAQGTTAGYTVTVGALGGFTGSVGLSITGLPSGANATFSPPTINTSGSSDLTVSTNAATPAGTYTLTVRGTSGPLTRTVNVSLVVTPVGDFTIAATPTSRTVQNGSNGTYTVTIAPVGAFASAVSFSVGPLPKFVTATFSPSTITQSGNSVLTLTTRKQTKAGTSTITVTGTSGTLSHSVTVTLIVQ